MARPWLYQVKLIYVDPELHEPDELVLFATSLKVEEGSDEHIVLEALADVPHFLVLDELEARGIPVEFYIEPVHCMDESYVGPCDDATTDYYTMFGRARLTWELKDDKAIIHLRRIPG